MFNRDTPHSNHTSHTDPHYARLASRIHIVPEHPEPLQTDLYVKARGRSSGLTSRPCLRPDGKLANERIPADTASRLANLRTSSLGRPKLALPRSPKLAPATIGAEAAALANGPHDREEGCR